MKAKFRNTVCSVLACGGAFLIAPESHANLVNNGGFESGLTSWSCITPDGNCGTGAFGGPQEGAVHFWGYDNGPGGLTSQSFITEIGATYSLSFFYGSSESSPTNNLSLDVGDFSQDFVVTDYTWNFLSTTFTAVSATSALDFTFDTNSGSGTLWLDDIVVEAVPAPAGLALLGLGLAGLGLSRKKKVS